MKERKPTAITIDSRSFQAWENQTILQAARDNGVYIPSLCALEHLPSYGACRLCIVEVDGLRGYPTACTTPVQEGMVIRTDTLEVRNLRKEFLRLLLSEHPGSCLFCDERDRCSESMTTIRKVGLTTGCRFCPSDHRCELQELTEKIGLTETSFPVYYRNLTPEKGDPFYDRDYNLCILCGRCIRVCNDTRLNGTLSFKKRGQFTTIGPAFEHTHLEAGCEFCGACVDACPVGALSAKTAKWYGATSKVRPSTCLFCPVGCRLLLQENAAGVIDARPDYSSPVDGGLLCVKGRFALPEVLHHPLRVTAPFRSTPFGKLEVSWEESMREAAAKIGSLKPEEVLFLVSPQLSNEDLYAAQEFSRRVVGSPHLFSSVAFALGADLPLFLRLAAAALPLATIGESEGIVTVGFDSTYGFSALGIAVKKAAQRGIPLVTLDFGSSNLAFYAEVALDRPPAEWAEALSCVGGLTEVPKADKGEIAAAAALLKRSSSNLLVIDAAAFMHPERGALLRAVAELRDKKGWPVILTHPFANLLGMLAMGAISGLQPGEVLRDGGKPTPLPIALPDESSLTRRWKLVYCIGEVPGLFLPAHDALIVQSSLPLPPELYPDLVLPAALFAETAGTTVNLEGRLLELSPADGLPGSVKPGWAILGQLASQLGKDTMAFSSLVDVQGAIARHIPGFPAPAARLPFRPLAVAAPAVEKRKRAARPAASAERPFLLHWRHDADSYLVPLAAMASGLAELGDCDRLLISAADAEKLKLSPDQPIDIGGVDFHWSGEWRIDEHMAEGTLKLTIGCGPCPAVAPCPVWVRSAHE